MTPPQMSPPRPLEAIRSEIALLAGTSIAFLALPPSASTTARRLLELLNELEAAARGERPPYYTREHLSAALTWIERNTDDGIALVARALSETGR